MRPYGHPCREHEGSARARADDRVGEQPVASLVPAQRDRGTRAEVAVERALVETAAREQVLQHCDVEAEVAGPQDALAEQRPPERPERSARLRIRDPVHRQV